MTGMEQKFGRSDVEVDSLSYPRTENVQEEPGGLARTHQELAESDRVISGFQHVRGETDLSLQL